MPAPTRVSALGGAAVLLAGCAFPHPDTLRRSPAAPPAPAAEACAPLPRATPAEAGLDAAAFAALVDSARASDTDALVVLRHGRVVGEWYWNGARADRRHSLQSVTKPVTGLVLGTLVGEGKVRGGDQPVGDFLPVWRGGTKAGLTLADLLTHTSGLGTSTLGSTALYFRRDALAYAAAKPIVHPPRTRFAYSNDGVMVLSGVVEAAAGRPLAAVARANLLDPLCITDARWSGDRKGHTFGQADLELRPMDLAKLGQLTLDGGAWRGRQVVPRAWVDAAVSRHGADSVGFGRVNYAWLWTLHVRGDSTRLDSALVARLRAAGADSQLVAWTAARATGWRSTYRVVEALDSTYGVGRGRAAWFGGARGVEPARKWADPWMWMHDGDLGQGLLVVPRAGLVVVRMRASTTPRTLRALVRPDRRASGVRAVVAATTQLAVATIRREQAAGAGQGRE